jgi:hypothetical protein
MLDSLSCSCIYKAFLTYKLYIQRHPGAQIKDDNNNSIATHRGRRGRHRLVVGFTTT